MADRRSSDALKVHNDTSPHSSAPINPATMPDIDDTEAAKRLADLNKLLDLMRPAVQADGGDLVLVSVDVRSGVVEVQLEGACSSCAISSTTLEAGVERLLTQRLGWVTEVRGGVEDIDDWDASAAMGRGGWVAAERA